MLKAHNTLTLTEVSEDKHSEVGVVLQSIGSLITLFSDAREFITTAGPVKVTAGVGCIKLSAPFTCKNKTKKTLILKHYLF